MIAFTCDCGSRVCRVISEARRTEYDGIDNNEATVDLLLVQRPMESTVAANGSCLCCWLVVWPKAV